MTEERCRNCNPAGDDDMELCKACWDELWSPAKPVAEPDNVLWDGEYEKNFYWVWPPDGSARVMCWPNAGLMNATDSSGRRWKPEDNVRVQMITEEDEAYPPRLNLRKRESAVVVGERVHRHVETAITRRSSAGLQVLLAMASLGAEYVAPPDMLLDVGTRDRREDACTHGFGFAGGFSECSACGFKRKKRV